MNSDRKLTDQAGKRLLDYLQNDLRCISNEAKKKMPALKEVRKSLSISDVEEINLYFFFLVTNVKKASEAGIVRLRSVSSRSTDLITGNCV